MQTTRALNFSALHGIFSLLKKILHLQVAKETEQAEGQRVEYTGVLFQPVPWSPTTKKGMPQEFEKYHADPDYVMINIPPNFMFKVRAAQLIALAWALPQEICMQTMLCCS